MVLFWSRRKADIALIGLAVMGQNLILNMDEKGFVVCAYNRTVAKVKDFLANEAKGTNVIGADSLQDMVSKLKTPRKVMLLVKGEFFALLFIHFVLHTHVTHCTRRKGNQNKNRSMNMYLE